MSDPDRDRPLSFDARQPGPPRRPAPVMLIVSLLILVGLIIALAVAYRGGTRGADDAPRVVGDAVGDIKTPAADDQPSNPALGLKIYDDEKAAPNTAAPQFGPGTEQPQPRPATVAPPPAPTPAPVAKPALAPTPAPTPAAKAPAPAPAVQTPAPAAAPAGSVSAQVGAFTSAALADKGWADAVRLAPGLAAGKGKAVQEVQVNGRTVYRALVTGFDSRAGASAFCASVTAAGGACLVR